MTTYKLRTGETIYTRTTYGRGMTDYVRTYIKRAGQHVDITDDVAELIGGRMTDKGIAMGGCGYSKPFQVVYGLGRALRPVFRCTGTRSCRSNDHFNERTPDYRKGRRHSDGGYAFSQTELYIPSGKIR